MLRLQHQVKATYLEDNEATLANHQREFTVKNIDGIFNINLMLY